MSRTQFFNDYPSRGGAVSTSELRSLGFFRRLIEEIRDCAGRYASRSIPAWRLGDESNLTRRKELRNETAIPTA